MKFNSFKFKNAQFKVVEISSTVVCTDTLEEAKRVISARRANGCRYAQIAKIVNRAGEVVYR